MTISVSLVCTHTDLADEVGGTEALSNLIPADWGGDSLKARQSALDEVLENLLNKTPRIEVSDLSNVAELRRVVMYGALEKLYGQAITSSESHAAYQQKRYEGMYRATLRGLNPTLSGGNARGTAFAIGLERR